MAHLGFQLTGSGVTDCAGGCGEHVMTSDLSKPAFCGDGECVADDLDDDTVSVVMTCCDTTYATVAETIGHVCPTPEHSGNRVWTVRAGTDGIGLDLFHVYAPDMDAARESAREAGKAAGFVFGDNFTVHAHRDGEPLDWFVKLGNNIVTDRPAIDFPAWTHEEIMNAAADLIALALIEMILDEIVKLDVEPLEGDGFSPYM
jgi:hypothetical protein